MLVGFKIAGRFFELLPNLALSRSQKRSLLEESANPVAPDFGGRMKPTEESHAREAVRQDMLEEAANEFSGLQGQGFVLAGVGVAIGPKNLAGGEEL